MRKIKGLLATIVLSLSLALTSFAGEIPGPGTNPNCPENQTCSNSTGEIPGPGAQSGSGESTEEAVSLDPVTEAMLTLLQSLLSLF
jgi:hypothetical protein